MSEYAVCRQFEGNLLTLESINQFPDTTEKEHFFTVREMLEREGFDPDDFRIGEIPTEYVYYFERAVEESGVDYFSVYLNEKGTLIPQFTTLQCDENGRNTFDCTTIRESIDRHEC
ncbi:hypothetical protein [Enterococcus sp. ZJ1668]|uniref:hypothetical protein n=1 Tax=Enterococcus sp. ZJ1668 TaxID=2709402 RepID=UPI0013EBB026|nr:hypothetical protein [Enterococcus sp. ZJ1668]